MGSSGSKISVIGAGYVGLSNALVLSQKNDVTLYDIDKLKISSLASGISPIKEEGLINFLKNDDLNICFTNDEKKAFHDKDFIVIATPTNYDPEKQFFDLKHVEVVVKKAVSASPQALIVIKSTIPIGCVDSLKEKYLSEQIIFSPEFLREGLSLEDNLSPSRIIIGGTCSLSRKFGKLLLDSSLKRDCPVLYMESKTAESVKLFANNYLAMRVCFFNELDNFALLNNLDAKDIINGIKYDSRIGDFYNNPSFGYGGYCLPKDTKQLLSNYDGVPQDIFSAIVKSNITRKKLIAQVIIERMPKTVGIYRLNMKTGSDNFRDSAVLDIVSMLIRHGIEINIYEPLLNEEIFNSCRVFKSLSAFADESDVILANRVDSKLDDYSSKVFSRDIFHIN